MIFRSRTRPRPLLDFDQFELRLALSVSPTSLTIPLDPEFDQFGSQIETIQAYGDPSQATFGIFDTGASVVTVSSEDRSALDYNGSSIPVKVPGGAVADGIGGGVIGDVSQPGTIWADGIHASSLSFDSWGFPTFEVSFGPDSAQVPGVQVFLGTDSGSPDLPTVTGTPVLNPSPTHPNGLGALVDLQGYTLDFSDIFPGLVLAQPDLHFVSPTTTLTGSSETTAPVRIPLSMVGEDNHENPGDLITASSNPVINNVSLVSQSGSVVQQSFLFDTGAQLSVISTAEAAALGLDLSQPESVITIQGVGGTEDVPGFTLPSLTIPLNDGGTLVFTNVPVYVLDAAPGVVDGIFGMNLLNTAVQALYNPFDPLGPSLSLTFSTDPDRGLGGFNFFTLLAGQGTGAGSIGTESDASVAGSEAGTIASMNGGQQNLPAPSVFAVAPIHVFVPGEAGTDLVQSPIDTRSAPTTAAVATSQGTSAASARPAQALPGRAAVVEFDGEELAMPVEDATLDALANGPTLSLDQGTIPKAPLNSPSSEVLGAERPTALSGPACDHWLTAEDRVKLLSSLVAEPSTTLAQEVSLQVLPVASVAGFAAILGRCGYRVRLSEEWSEHKRRRSAIRVMIESI